MRILIAGPPRTGKTTLSEQMSREHQARLWHTDDLIGVLDWSAASQRVSEWFEYDGRWIVEGVAVPRAIRKWFRRTAEKPADLVIWLRDPKEPLSQKQQAMGKACRTVFDEVLPALMTAGVTIREQ